MKKTAVSGFTLLELMIAIAIIGILTAILVPSVHGYYVDSQLRTANSNSKIIFNAAQTIAQRYEIQERALGHVTLDGADGQVAILCENGNATNAVKTGGAADLTQAQEFCDRVNDIATDGESICWAVYIDEYIVKVSVSGNSLGSSYAGRYPVGAQDKGDVNFAGATLRGTGALTELQSQAALYTNWNTP